MKHIGKLVKIISATIADWRSLRLRRHWAGRCRRCCGLLVHIIIVGNWGELVRVRIQRNCGSGLRLCRPRLVNVAGATSPGNGGHCHGRVTSRVLRDGETNRRAIMVIDGQKSSKERIPKYKKRTARGGHVKSHERCGALPIALVNVVFGLQIQNLGAERKTKARHGIEIGAVVFQAKLFVHGVNKCRGASQHGCASIDCHLATRGSTQARLLLVKCNIVHAYLPV
mmetsp:Transcript_54266/g.118930  ORF Transcript_54266/g.118930 Transcript_54266/m.118930 type:complete len:226 (+) Transcript_54266:426-1103(+)